MVLLNVSDLIKLISSYNIFNNLLPGVVFCVLVNELIGINLSQDDVVTGFFFYYFIGLLISRVGSIIIESTLKKLKLIRFGIYSDFISASKNDSKIELLLESSNMYRNLISMSLCMLILYLYIYIKSIYPALIEYDKYISLSLLLLIFSYSYVKQNEYIFNRVELSKGNRDNGVKSM